MPVYFCRISSQKYAPIDWLGYFDQEDDIRIQDSNDVSHIILLTCLLTSLIILLSEKIVLLF